MPPRFVASVVVPDTTPVEEVKRSDDWIPEMVRLVVEAVPKKPVPETVSAVVEAYGKIEATVVEVATT